MDKRVYIVMYHYVREIEMSRYPGIKGLEVRHFRNQIEYMKKYFSFISPDDLLNALNGGTLPHNAILLTFDDGYIDHYTHVFSILKNYKISGFFSMPGKILAERKMLDVHKIHFVLAVKPIKELLPMVFTQLDRYRGSEYPIPSNRELYEKLAIASRFDCREVMFLKRLLQAELPERLRSKVVDGLFRACVGISEEIFVRELYMDRDQVRLMSREGMCFGIHGYEHNWMNRLALNVLDQDIDMALDVFDGIIDRRQWICCYPYGLYSDEVIECVRQKGAVAGITVNVDIARIDRCDRYRLPRFDTNDFPPQSERYINYT